MKNLWHLSLKTSYTKKFSWCICVCFLLMIIIFANTNNYATQYAPLFIKNKTPSVPLGYYKKISKKYFFTRKKSQLENKAFYLLLDSTILNRISYQEIQNRTSQKSALFISQKDFLIEHNIPLLKKISNKDIEYILSYKKLPLAFFVESQHAKGIDSNSFGSVPIGFVRGIYVLTAQR